MPLMSTEEAVRAFYRDRLSNDAEELHSWLAPNARLTLNGVPGNPSLRDERNEEALTYLRHLTETWMWRDYRLDSLLVDGHRAATQTRILVEYRPTGEANWSSISDHFEFDGERFTSLVEYLDTWLLRQMSSAD